jgi:hypothetical protein
MSFGYAIGDFVLLTQLAWDVVQNSRKACGAHDELTSEVTSLHIVLRRLEIEVSKPNSILTRSDDNTDRKGELAQLSEDSRRVLRTLDGILRKYNALSEEKRSVTKLWKRVQFGNGEMLDLAELRLKITTSTLALTLFLNLLSIGSQGKVESYMESQGDELREMRRSLNWITASMQAKAPKAGEGSILTTYAGDDKAIWKDFRRELIKEGFSSEVLQRHKETIKEYVMELGDRDALDDVDDDFETRKLSLEGTAGWDEEESMTVEGGVEPSEPGLEDESEVESVDEHKMPSEETSKKSAEQCPDQGQEQQSNRKPDEEPEKDKGEFGLHTHTEVRNSGEIFESKGKDAVLNGKDPLLFDKQHNFEDMPNPEAQLPNGDEPIISKTTTAAVESQTGNDSQPVFRQVESIDEIKSHGVVENGSLAGESSRAPAHLSMNAADVANNPLFDYNPRSYINGNSESLIGIKHQWFGPYNSFKTPKVFGTRWRSRLHLPSFIMTSMPMDELL